MDREIRDSRVSKSRTLNWVLRRAPRLAAVLRQTVQGWAFEDPRMAAKVYAYRAQSSSYLIHGAKSEGGSAPIPPKDMWLGYADDPAHYLEVGKRRVDRMMQIVEASGGLRLQAASRVLDFGCASGIMLRWFDAVAATGEAWGVDIAATPILWCQQNLSPPFRFATTTSFPHLPFEDRYFDFVYAGSVFTHIADLAEAWLLELRRILRPGGILFATVHDSAFINAVLNGTDPRRQRVADLLREYDRRTNFTSTGFSMFAINRIPGPGGTGQAQVFYDTEYLRRHWASYFTVLSIVPDALGGLQAGVVLRKDS